jgi:plasmid maintenance system antidote protein VapI
VGTYAQRAISGSDPFCLRPSERLWINLQARYDLEVEKDWLGAALDDIQPMSAAG